VDVLIYADTLRCPELRHEVPVAVIDPFLYAERDGKPFAVISKLDADQVRAARGDLGVIFPEELGWDELLAAGISWAEAELELSLRAIQRLGIERAAVLAGFPLELADRLRGARIEIEADRGLFESRRRSKSPIELDGIQRAQRAAEAGMATAATILVQCEPGSDSLLLDGKPLTSEWVKAEVEKAIDSHGAKIDEMIVASGPPAARGHEMGSGPIAPGEPVVVDLWPQDVSSSCFADMTRTFLIGRPSDKLEDWRTHTLTALERAVEAIRPGMSGRQIYKIACDVFQSHGYPTQLTKPPGEVLHNGFYWGLGHGVGLEVHEPPNLGRAGGEELQVGDILAIEPGLAEVDVGEYRVEDLVRVTDDGAQVMTSFHYELAP
jgi:Xaa-Pro aminopeptidase